VRSTCAQVRGRRRSHVLKLIAFEETAAHIVFPQHRNVWHVQQPAALRARRKATYHGELAVDFRVLGPRRFCAIVVLDRCLAMGDERPYVGGGDRAHTTTAEERQQCSVIRRSTVLSDRC